jgi:CHAT domain-containing protein/Tfp pilus assembly protein PilF
MKWDQYANALKHYKEALRIKRETGDVRGEAYTLNNIGIVYARHANYFKAVQYYQESLDIYRKIGDVKAEGNSLSNLAGVYINWGQHAKAMECYQKALEIAGQTGDRRREGATLNQLGVAYVARGQYSKSLEYSQKALVIARNMGDAVGEGRALENLGTIYKALGDHVRALSSYEEMLASNRRIGVPTKISNRILGHLYLDVGDLEKAESAVKESGSWDLAGRLALLRFDYATARQYYQEIHQMAERSRRASDLFTSHTGLGLACEGLKEIAEAAEYFRKAVEHTEEVRYGLSSAERAEFYNVRIDGFSRTAPYEGLARVLMKMNTPEEALKESEYTKARAFSEGLSRKSPETKLDLPAQVLDKDESVNNQLAALAKSLQQAYEKQNKDVIASLEPQLKDAKQMLAVHVGQLRKEYPLFAATRYPQPMELEQAAVRDSEWTLSYDVTDSGLVIVLTRGKKVVSGLFKPVPRKEVDTLVRTFRQPLELDAEENISQKLTTFDFATGKNLSDILLADILPDLPKGTPVIIIPDDCLGVLPFEMLVLNDGGKILTDKKIPYVSGAEFFGDRNPISYYQSITALTLARTLGKHRKGGDKLIAMVDPVFSESDSRLVQMAKEEKNKILASLPKDLLMSIQTETKMTFPRLPLTGELGQSLKKAAPDKTDLYEGFKAKKSTLLEKDLTGYRSVVFATHGYFGKDLPGIQEPVLVLTLVDQPKDQDGFLRLSEVMGLKINADIVALTACQTGLGRHISGEGTMGMGRAFQYAGAKSVLMSLWAVSETASVKLVESFFKHCKEGKNKLEALKLARTEVRESGADHPFFWAPFILVGEVE